MENFELQKVTLKFQMGYSQMQKLTAQKLERTQS